jgi:hypothetical protein
MQLQLWGLLELLSLLDVAVAGPPRPPPRRCFSLPHHTEGAGGLKPPPANDWTRDVVVLQPWGRTQWVMARNASRLAIQLREEFGFNTLILLPAPAHNAYCGAACELSDREIRATSSTFREAGWHVILYTSFMHCGEAERWQNGSLSAAHPQWVQRNASGAAWEFEGKAAALSPCSGAVDYTLTYTAAQASVMRPDAVMLDNNEFGPMAWGCATSGCGYEHPCQEAFRAYAKALFNRSTLADCFGVSSVATMAAPTREQLGSPLYGLWLQWRNVVMARVNRRFASGLLRSESSHGNTASRLVANTAIDWPDFSLSTDLQYAAEHAVLSEIYTTDPISLHEQLSLGAGLAQGRPFWAALYQNKMAAVELSADQLASVLVSAVAHAARPWLVFESSVLLASPHDDNRTAVLQAVHRWRSREGNALLPSSSGSMAPLGCMASATTRNSKFYDPASGSAIKPARCLRRAMELGVPARVVYEMDSARDPEWLDGVRVLVLDTVLCLPGATITALVRWLGRGGRMLASSDSGTCDQLGRALPDDLTMWSSLAQWKSAATKASINSSAATSLLRELAWLDMDHPRTRSIAAPPARRIVVPFNSRLANSTTTFVLCGEEGPLGELSCRQNGISVQIPRLLNNYVARARLTSLHTSLDLSRIKVQERQVQIDVPPTAATSFAIIIDWTARPSSKKWSQ